MLLSKSIKIVLISFMIANFSSCQEAPTDPPPPADQNISLTDVDGNTYQAVKIGNKYWTTENYKAVSSANGQNLLSAFAYNGDNSNAAAFGRLYTWTDAVLATPVGWHLPTQAEWEELINSFGGSSVAGGNLKETGTAHWNSPNSGATNSSGLTIIAGGFRGPDEVYYDLGKHGSYWGSAVNGNEPYCVYIYNTSANVITEVSPADKTSGIAFAVRYVRD